MLHCSTIIRVEHTPQMEEYFKWNMLRKQSSPVGELAISEEFIDRNIYLISTAIGLRCNDGVVMVVEKVCMSCIIIR